MEKISMNLQHFNEAVQGKKLIYLYRLLSEATSEDAKMVAYATENSRSVSIDADSTATKDGAIRTPGVPEIEITSTSVLKKGDPMIDTLEDAMLEGKTFEVWEVNLEEPAQTEGKFKAIYYQALMTELEKSSSAEDFVEISLTFGCNGTGERGEATVSAQQQEDAKYAFADTVKTTGA